MDHTTDTIETSIERDLRHASDEELFILAERLAARGLRESVTTIRGVLERRGDVLGSGEVTAR